MGRPCVAVILAAVFAGVPSLASAKDSEPGVFVWMHNYADLPEPTLEHAESVAATVFTDAGLTIEWVDPVASDGRRFEPSDLVLRTVTSSMIADWGLDTGDLAFALVPETCGSGYIAGVITDRVERVAGRSGYPMGTLLGYVMAHELGHLLLGTKRHSNTGVMSFPVDQHYLLRGSKGMLHFGTSEIRRIRAEIAKRNNSSDTN